METVKDAALVSVIMPVYNAEEFLPEALDSVLASTYPNIEIILIDDGSTDGSLAIARRYALQYPHVCSLQQPNAGASVARNEAIRQAKGEYLLPVDVDDRISPEFISLAMAMIQAHPDITVVCPSAEFIGARKGQWKLPPFSLRLLARKNMLSICALFRRADWERVGGYRSDVGREDWVFWISVLKDGGSVVRLPHVGLYYRIQAHSKRKKDRCLLRHTIDVLNRLYPAFFLRELKGPLRYRRTWSRHINTIHSRQIIIHPDFKEVETFVCNLPDTFDKSGETIHDARNKVKIFDTGRLRLNVKQYRVPLFINRIVYALFRPTKASRAYTYALRLLSVGFDTPQPVAYIHLKRYGLLHHCYFVSLQSPYTRRMYEFGDNAFGGKEHIIRALARYTARLHEAGIYHKDYSPGNILFEDNAGDVRFTLVDLNRMAFRPVSVEQGCANLSRLWGNETFFRILAQEYAIARGANVEQCIQWTLHYRKRHRRPLPAPSPLSPVSACANRW